MTTETILTDERLIEMAANELQEPFDRPLPSKLVEVQSDGAVVAIREVDVGGINVVGNFQLAGLVQRPFEAYRVWFVVGAFTATTASVIGANVYASDFGKGFEVDLSHRDLLVG